MKREMYKGYSIRENKKGFYANGDNINFYGSTIQDVKSKIDTEVKSDITYTFYN